MSIAEKLTQIAENEQKVYDAGKTKEWNDFWDSYQQNGKRTKYYSTFGNDGWTDITFKPKYDIRSGASPCFDVFRYAQITDLEAILKKQKVKLDTSKATNLQRFIQFSTITRVGTIDCTGLTEPDLKDSFSRCPIKTIGRLVLKPEIKYTTTFNQATELENLSITDKYGSIIGGYFDGTGTAYNEVPVIGNDLNLSDCTKLTRTSLVSVICALANDGTTHTLTLGTTNLAKLSDAEKAMATQKGWTLA
jgi:hypothetical protein